ncbi:MAG TPA: aldo/keto reductase, partial [Candidatus Limnocylindria bacterium]|nr:aldo/keto reductase [Candidatus Limnocylindria bacterium]
MQPDLPGYVAPDAIPARALRTGALVPGIGYGTFSARYSPAEVGAATLDALRMGYRMLDCAAAYGNEPSIGEAIPKAAEYGIARKDLFILGKLPNTMHGRQNVAAACRKSLSDLGLTWLDAFLVHWPVPNALSPDAAKGIYTPESRPYVHVEFMDTLRGMEDLVREGLVRAIGVSNVTVGKLRRILRDASIPPAINEMESHPAFQQDSLFRFSAENGVLPVAYSPLGSPARPERNRMPGDAVDTQEP